MSVNGASILYSYRENLKKKIQTTQHNTRKTTNLYSTVSAENGNGLCRLIKEMQPNGLPLTINDTRRTAFNFAEQSIEY